MADKIMADAAVELRNVSSGYGETVVLEDLNLKVAPGESISVIGRNGVGKTTLLATVMGHTTLHKGDVLLGGKSLNGVPIYRRAAAGIGFVPQEREIFPSLTVRENLDVGAQARRLDRRAAVRAVPQPCRAPHQQGQSALRRRAADAVDRARAADEPVSPADGRADRRSRRR